MADIFDFVDERARTLDHVDTQIRLGGQHLAAVVKKTHSAHMAGQNQPSEAASSSTIDACYTQGYDRGYNMGARKFGSQRQFAPNPRTAKFGQEGGFVRNAGKSPNVEKTTEVARVCGRCKGTHDLLQCDEFKKLSVGEGKI